MNQDIFRKILEDHKKLSSLPQVLVEVIRVANNSDTSIADLSNVVKKDPGLSTRLLRVVNSPYYAPTNKITTVSQAVASLGTRAVTAFALSSSIYELMSSDGAFIDRKKFWRHALEVAMIARKIADAVGYQPAEEAFTAGLLHDVGVLILEASFSDTFKEVWKLVGKGSNLTAVEETYWSTNHARAGQFILNQWNIPKVISDAVGEHHLKIDETTENKPHRLSLIVNLANACSKFRIHHMPPAESEQLENKKNLAAELELTHTTLADIERSIISDVVSESGYLEIDIGSVEEILRDANELLYNQYILAERLLQERNEMQKQLAVDPDGQRSVRSLKEALSVFGKLVQKTSAKILEQSENMSAMVKSKNAADNKNVIDSAVTTIHDHVDSIYSLIKEMENISNGKSFCNHELVADIQNRFENQIKSRKPGRLI